MEDEEGQKGWNAATITKTNNPENPSLLFHKQHNKQLHDVLVLDSASSIDFIGNKKFITKIEEDPHKLTLGTNRGKLQVKTKATLPNYGKVWFCENSITNIISLAGMASKYQVRYNSWIEDAFLVHMDTGIKQFSWDKDNLYKYIPTTSA